MSRYIDADKVLEKINKICKRCGKMNENNGALCGACYFDDAKDIIDDFPTEEVRPDISGEWMNYFKDEKHPYHDFLLFCSNCNEFYVIAEEMSKWNFCPNCGAKMKKESEEEE